jgi:hypothetical protein
MKIWDTFLFFNELDLLECRLTELYGNVDRFVIVESPLTFQGIPKPLHYADNKDRFAPWKDKIVHVVADLPDGSLNEREQAFHREAAQREYIFNGLTDAAPEDIILLSDVDEIPSRNIVNPYMWTGVSLQMAYHMFAVDWMHPSACHATLVQRMGGISDFQKLRDMKGGWPKVENAGHHFTFLGGPDSIREKLNAYSHVELRDWLLNFGDRLYADGLGFAYEGHPPAVPVPVQQRAIEIDDTFPQWIRERKCPAIWFRPKGE